MIGPIFATYNAVLTADLKPFRDAAVAAEARAYAHVSGCCSEAEHDAAYALMIEAYAALDLARAWKAQALETARAAYLDSSEALEP